MILTRRSYLFLLSTILIVGGLSCRARSQNLLSPQKGPWVPDVGEGEYRNPIIFADYSDPDVCRKGDPFFLIASSFLQFQGLPDWLRGFRLVQDTLK